MVNRVVLVGRLTADPELKYTPSGKAVASFTVAVDRRQNSQGEKETDFIPIVAWQKSAEFASNYLSKGRLVAIDGRLQIRSWVAQDGTRRKTAEVVAESVQGLDRPKERTEAAANAAGDDSGFNAPAPTEDFDDPFADE
ncbi:MAG: single-stranded DNA-binding protein [Armatimonadota bacterium]